VRVVSGTGGLLSDRTPLGRGGGVLLGGLGLLLRLGRRHSCPGGPLLELDSRRVYLAGVTANPNGGWVTQQARNLLLALDEQGRQLRFLVRDRDAKFSRGFDDVFRSEGAQVLMTPVHAPKANAYAERWVRTVRADCLDWLLIVGRRHLEQTLRIYVEHYNRHRPHRALKLHAPDQPAGVTVAGKDRRGGVRRRDLLGGLLHEYRRAA
jgi:putative transposase